MSIQEGKIKVDLKRIMTRIMGALEFKTDPKVKAMRKKLNDELEKVYAKMKEVKASQDQIEAAVDAGKLDDDDARDQWEKLDVLRTDLEDQRDDLKVKISQLKGK